MDNTNISQDTHNPSASTEEGPPTRQKPSIGHVVIPYTQLIAESFKKIHGKYWIQIHFKGNTTIKQLLMMPKDQDPNEKKSGVICSYQCGEIACDEEYVGETSRTLGEGYREHLKQSSPSMCTSYIQDTLQHQTTSTSLGGWTRAWPGPWRKAIYIRVKQSNFI